MISEFSKKIYAVVLSAALIFSMSAGSFGTAYALDEAEEQQTEKPLLFKKYKSMQIIIIFQ